MEFRPLYQSSYFLAATCGSDLYGVSQGTAVLYVTHIFFFFWSCREIFLVILKFLG